MKRPHNTAIYKEIVASAARTAFAGAWADYMEEKGHGHELSGQELTEIAPKTPGAANKWAKKLVHVMEKMNGKTIEQMYNHAIANESSRTSPRDFGSSLALDALGTGAGWSDYHKDHGFLVPSCEFNMFGSRDFYAEVCEREGLARRC